MTRKEIVDVINRFEAEHPVDEWTIDGIHVWPMIKIDLFWSWHHLYHDDKSSTVNIGSVEEITKYQKIINLFLGFTQWIKLSLSIKSRKESVLFIGNAGTNISFNNKIINRYYQPIFDYLLDDFSDDINAIYYREDNLRVDAHIKTIDEKDNKIIYFLYHFYRTKKGIQLREIDSFISLFEKQGLINSKKQFLTKLNMDVRELKSRSFYIQKLIKKYNVKAIFELCYYGNKRYAYNIAAYNSGIPSYDIQHGGMGNEHVAYANLNKVPKNGYEILPSHFWLWDEVSFKLVNKWVSKQNFHSCLIGGNPWLDYFFENSIQEVYSINNGKKIILYTMQYSIIDDYILETIKQTPDEYIWWLRLHPRKIEDQNLIKETLHNHGIFDKVEIEKATFYPLPYVLTNCCVHISAFSGSIIEASLLNTTSIIIDEIGVSSYYDYIESGQAVKFLEKDSISLLNLIEKIANQKKDVNLIEKGHDGYKKIINNLV